MSWIYLCDSTDRRREFMKPIAFSRNKFRLGALLGAPIMAAFLMNGCLSSADRDSASPGAETPSETPDPAKGAAVLESMGYAKDEIQQVEGGFVVQGDMVFRLSDLIDSKNAPLAKTAQRQSAAISNPAPQRVSVAIHSSMGSAWIPIVSQAVNEWNSVNTRLHLVLSLGGAASIMIYADSSAACPAILRNLNSFTLGRSFAASGGSPGPALSINTDDPTFTNVQLRVQVVTHELGHAIGLHHTGTTSGTQIPGTPATDGFSLMNDGGNVSNVLSAEDIKALEILYPSDKPLGGTDLDGDFKDDIVVWRPATGTWHVLASTTGFTSGISTQWGQRGDFPVADMDLDGDGRDDKVVWRPVDGSWHILHTLSNTTRSIQFGQRGDVPIANHDMDGDGRDDLVLWRWKEGKFLWRNSALNFVIGGSFAWGALGDIPVGGIDADRDGTDDWVVWRPSDSRFYVAFSSTGFTTSQSFLRGVSSDVPVGGADLDLDGKDDLTVLLGGNAWSALLSGSNFASQRFISTGHAGSVPVTGTDIDQDGLRDLVTWIPATGTWLVKKSSSNFAANATFIWGQ
jgi:hypothetical protein